MHGRLPGVRVRAPKTGMASILNLCRSLMPRRAWDAARLVSGRQADPREGAWFSLPRVRQDLCQEAHYGEPLLPAPLSNATEHASAVHAFAPLVAFVVSRSSYGRRAVKGRPSPHATVLRRSFGGRFPIASQVHKVNISQPGGFLFL